MILILILISVLLLFYGPPLGYTTITSKFGPRKSPTTGVQSYHYGLDIGAPTGSNIIAIFSGTVTFTGFNGANGFTVTITNGILSASYSHVSPTFLVYKGQYINQGEIIAIVGPKNVYGVPNNPYKDSNGNPTNRFYNRTSFTFKHKERRQSRRSFKLFLHVIFFIMMTTRTIISTFIITITFISAIAFISAVTLFTTTATAIIAPVQFYYIVTFWAFYFIF